MSQGYLVQLGDGTLDPDDAIALSAVGFEIDQTIGTGTWVWTGVDGGTSVTDQSETGTYHLGTDGNVYFVPDTGTKDAVTAAATSSTPDYANEVLGTAGGDVIAGDSGSEVIFGGTSASPAGTGADTIDGGAGGDVIHGGDGNDIVEGGGDDDVIFGGDGNDEIYGDAAAPVITSTETLEWISGARGGGTDLSSGFVHDSGGMQVSVSFTNDGGNTGISGSTSAQYVGTTGLDPNSGVLLTGGAGPNVTASISFEADAGSGLSNEVENVVFLINDVDADGWEDIITVNAYDVDGNPVAVTLTALGGDTVSGQTVTAEAGDRDSASEIDGAVLVEIAGPVHSIEIVYENGGTSGQALWVSDVQYDTLAPEDGDDEIEGGSGDDLIYGGDGNDTVTLGAGDDTVDGGAGNDTLSGDAGDDVFSLTGAFGDDQITGGETGETAGDTLDASDLTADLTVLLSDPETGTLGDGASTATFAEIEGIELGSGADEVQGSSGDDMVATGAGADIVDGGAGNDTFDVGSLDGAVDTVVLENGDGDTVVLGFEAPINDRGSIVGMDRLDVSNLLDGNGDPVDTSDVVLTDDGSGNARLEFPDGTSILLIGVSPTDVGSPELLEAMGIPLPVRDFTVSGTPGDDIIDGFYSLDPEGDVVDGNDAQDLSNDDIIEAGTGNDFVNAGDGNDIVFGGTGNDTLVGEGGDDTLFGGDGQDILNGVDGNDALYGGGGADSIEAGLGDDIVSGGGGDDSVNGDQGNDTVFGGEGNDFIRGSFGNDTVYGGEGDDYVWGGYGDDLHVVEDNFGNDTYFGDSEQEILGDTLDLSAVTSDLTVDLTDGNNENGSFTDGTSTATFTEIETIVLGGGVDTIVLSNTSGADAVTGFAAPTDNGDGTYSGNDQLDVSALTSDGTTPVHSGNVVVGADTDGNAVLTFPSGASITLVGIAPSDVTDTAALEAMGIPPDPRDGTVSGTAAGDVINVGYAGDPDGDRVDNNDAILPGDTGNDDLIEAGAGNDFIIAGDGDDVIHGGADSDTIIQNDGSGVDIIYGGEAGADDDRVDFASSSDPGGVTVTFDGDEQGSYVVGTSGATGQFFEIEQIAATGFDDTVDASADTSGILVDGLGGDDTITGGSGDDVLSGWDGDDLIGGGAGNDTVDGDAGNDVLNGGLGDDVVVGDGGDDTLIGGAGADQLFGGAGNDSLQVAEGDFVDGGAGDDYITLVDYGETGNSTLTVSGGAGGESAGDTLQLGSLADLSTLSATDDGTGSFSGSVTLDDGTILNFSEIENIICFTPGTRIATPRGARRVEELAVGDTVVTRDHGIQPIRWIGRRDVPARGRLAPIRLTPGVVTGLERDILVSPQHRMLFQGYRAELLFGESEVLVPAKHLVDGLAARVEEGSTVTYIHLLCDDHEILYAEGAATESFHPGEVGLTAVTAQAREELFTIFPELRALPRSFGPTARRALRRHESRLLL